MDPVYRPWELSDLEKEELVNLCLQNGQGGTMDSIKEFFRRHRPEL